jgi:3'-phosphoadenosine 5'-phosphosulfate sulfotransferase
MHIMKKTIRSALNYVRGFLQSRRRAKPRGSEKSRNSPPESWSLAVKTRSTFRNTRLD